MEWRIFADPLNLAELAVVPVPLLIDEHGVVRARPRSPAALAAFVAAEFPAPPIAAAVHPGRDLTLLRRRAHEENTSRAWRELGDAEFLAAGDPESAYLQSIARDPADGRPHFRLGVARLDAVERGARPSSDLQGAIDSLTTALQLDPGQYIWRRRLQQYGPRLDKPYDFYGWVGKARAEILAAGAVPVPLPEEPSGSELLGVLRRDASFSEPPDLFGATAPPPDPAGRVRVTPLVVPGRVPPGGRVRVRLRFELAPDLGLHWNDDGPGLRAGIASQVGLRLVDSQLDGTGISRADPAAPRDLECELEVSSETRSAITARFRATFEICDSSGICSAHRLDVSATIPVDPSAVPLGPSGPGGR